MNFFLCVCIHLIISCDEHDILQKSVCIHLFIVKLLSSLTCSYIIKITQQECMNMDYTPTVIIILIIIHIGGIHTELLVLLLLFHKER